MQILIRAHTHARTQMHVYVYLLAQVDCIEVCIFMQSHICV